jgi:hypothetical protein
MPLVVALNIDLPSVKTRLQMAQTRSSSSEYHFR